MKKNILKAIQTVAFIGLGIFFIFFFWGKLDAEEQKQTIGNFAKANYFWIALSLCAGILSHVLRAARWNLLIETFDKPPALGKTFWSVMAGYLANLAVPRLGEITRCALLSKQSKTPFDKLFGSVVAERAFDFIFFLILLVATTITFYSKLKTYLEDTLVEGFKQKLDAFSGWKVWVFLIVMHLLFLVIFMILRRYRHKPLVQKIRQVIKNLLYGIKSIFKLKRVGLFFLYTILIWIMYFLVIYLMYFSLPATSSLSMESAFVVLVFGTIGIIVIQGGIGIYPIIVSQVLLIYGASEADGFSIGWLSWGVQTIMILLLGLIAFIMVNIQHKKKNGLQTTDSK